MTIRTEWHTSEGVFIGAQAHVTFPTAGEHVVEMRRVDATTGQVVASRTVTVTTTEEPIESWAVTERGLPAGLVPHTGTLTQTEVGGLDDGGQPVTELLPNPALTGPRGPIPWTCPEGAPDGTVQYARATDFDPTGVMDWPALLTAMAEGTTWRAGAKRFLVLDYPPLADGSPRVLPHDAPGYAQGRAACLVIGAGGLAVDGIIGTGHTALQAPATADDVRLMEVWNRNSAVDAELAALDPPRTPDANGKIWATAHEMGNLTSDGAQHECRLIHVTRPCIIANLSIAEPAGAPNILGWNGIRIDQVAAVLVRLNLRGASWGWNGYPPGETACIAVWGVQDQPLLVADCTIDGSTRDGTRRGASPFSVASCECQTAPWRFERVTERGHTASMHTMWNTNLGDFRRLHVTTEDVLGPHMNQEDFNWLPWASMVSIGDQIGVVDYNPPAGRTSLHLAINSGPRAKDTHVSRQTWVNPQVTGTSALQYFSPGAGILDTLHIQSQLSYVGVDSVLGTTGPQSLRMDHGTQDGGGMGVRVWARGRWQQVASNKDEIDPDTGELLTPTAPDRSPLFPPGIGQDEGKRVAVFR